MKTARKVSQPWLFVLPAGVAALIFAVAMAVMLVYSFRPYLGNGQMGDQFTFEAYRNFLSDRFYLGYLWRSIWVSVYCTFITLLLGYVLAYAMYRSSRRVQIFVSTVLVIQFFTAYVIRIYALMLMLGRDGVVNNVLISLGIISQPVNMLFNELSVAIGLALTPLPFMVLPVLASLQAIPHNLETASSSLGARPLLTFFEVILPLSLPGIVAGVVIVFLFDMTSYIVPGVLGGGYYDMIANLIYSKAMDALNYPFAAAAAVIMTIITAAIVGAFQGFTKRAMRS